MHVGDRSMHPNNETFKFYRLINPVDCHIFAKIYYVLLVNMKMYFQMMHLETRQLIEDKTLMSANHPQNRSLNRYRDVLPCM